MSQLLNATIYNTTTIGFNILKIYSYKFTTKKHFIKTLSEFKVIRYKYRITEVVEVVGGFGKGSGRKWPKQSSESAAVPPRSKSSSNLSPLSPRLRFYSSFDGRQYLRH
jgi:hypothetical protein